MAQTELPPPASSPTKTTQTPLSNPPALPCSLPPSPLTQDVRLVGTRRAGGADVCPVPPLRTCRAPAHLLLKSPFTPTSLPPPFLPHPNLLPPPTLPPNPISPPLPCPAAQIGCSRVKAGRLSQRRDPFTTRPPHTDCRLPPAGIGAPTSRPTGQSGQSGQLEPNHTGELEPKPTLASSPS